MKSNLFLSVFLLLLVSNAFAGTISLKICESKIDIVSFYGGDVYTGVMCGKCQYKQRHPDDRDQIILDRVSTLKVGEIRNYKGNRYVCSESGMYNLKPGEDLLINDYQRVKCCPDKFAPCQYQQIPEGTRGYGARINFLELGESVYISKKTYLCEKAQRSPGV